MKGPGPCLNNLLQVAERQGWVRKASVRGSWAAGGHAGQQETQVLCQGLCPCHVLRVPPALGFGKMLSLEQAKGIRNLWVIFLPLHVRPNVFKIQGAAQQSTRARPCSGVSGGEALWGACSRSRARSTASLVRPRSPQCLASRDLCLPGPRRQEAGVGRADCIHHGMWLQVPPPHTHPSESPRASYPAQSHKHQGRITKNLQLPHLDGNVLRGHPARTPRALSQWAHPGF